MDHLKLVSLPVTPDVLAGVHCAVVVTDHRAFDYELIGLPTTFIIGRDGRIEYRFVGYLTGAVLRKALDDVVTGNVG